MTPFQTRNLQAKFDNPEASIDGRALRVLVKKGYIKDDAVTIYGAHALDHLLHRPKIDVPSDELIAEFRGKAVVISDYFVGEPEIAAIYGWSTVTEVETYRLDAAKVLSAYQRFTLAVNEYLADRWYESTDIEVHFGLLRRSVISYMIRDAKEKVDRAHDIFGYYTASIFVKLGEALMLEGKNDGLLLSSNSHKYSLLDNMDEVEPFQINDKNAEVVRTFRCEFSQ